MTPGGNRDQNGIGPNNGDGQDGGGVGDGELAAGFSFVLANAQRGFVRGEPFEVVTAVASFFAAGDVTTDDTNVDQTRVGPCVVTTGLPQGAEPPMAEPLDAGPSATLDNGATSIEFANQDVGFYEPTRDMLLSEGFGPGQRWTFTFPGGNDIGAFMVSLDLPEYLTFTEPDLDESSFSIDTNAPLTFAWMAADTADVVQVSLSTSKAGGRRSIMCTFRDDGAVTIPEEAMQFLINDAITAAVSVMRRNIDIGEVRLVTGATIPVQRVAQTIDGRLIVTPP